MATGSGDPAGAVVLPLLGLDRQIQARHARVGRFWRWSPDLAIRLERGGARRWVWFARAR
ncbi:MAG: hypothetical protein M5U01_02525 [Ardenticatenaceae bacterium]|nr:hypothetical protein [Ardenticatenaceae bacterium]